MEQHGRFAGEKHLSGRRWQQGSAGLLMPLHTMLFLVAAAVPEKEPLLTKVAKSRFFFLLRKIGFLKVELVMSQKSLSYFLLLLEPSWLSELAAGGGGPAVSPSAARLREGSPSVGGRIWPWA